MSSRWVSEKTNCGHRHLWALSWLRPVGFRLRPSVGVPARSVRWGPVSARWGSGPAPFPLCGGLGSLGRRRVTAPSGPPGGKAFLVIYVYAGVWSPRRLKLPACTYLSSPSDLLNYLISVRSVAAQCGSTTPARVVHEPPESEGM